MTATVQTSDVKFLAQRATNNGVNDDDLYNIHGIRSTDVIAAAALANNGSAAFGLKSTSSSAGVGYATGAGGAVTQATNRSTGVTLSKTTGQITTDTTSLAAAATAAFTVTNTTVAATDVVVVSIASGATTTATKVSVSAVAAGSFQIAVTNGHASTAETGAIIINFAVIKAVAA
jgi:hypothetical protein